MVSFDPLRRPLRVFFTQCSRIIASFSHTERSVFFALVWVFIIGASASLYIINRNAMIEIPAKGGSYTEGIIGTPRFINPLLAISDADRDLTSLVYAGLMRATPSGELIPDLASSYTVSNDGLSYTFILRKNLTFSDGEPITAEDVVFTIEKAQDSSLKSPKRANWDSVTAQIQDEQTIVFTLPRAYAPFLENTTIGIMPKHIWGDATSEEFSFSEYNTIPVGSGPYVVNDIKRDKSGVPSYYDLKPFKHYALGEPYISDIRIRFYQDEASLITAFKKSEIDGVDAITPSVAKELTGAGARIERFPLPRVFGVFFNQDKAPLFTDKSVREALTISSDKKRIVDEVLFGYGTVLSGPIPPGSLGYMEQIDPNASLTHEERLAKARLILEDAGWIWKGRDDGTGQWEKQEKKTTTVLSFSLATTNVPELKAVADMLVADWEALGIPVTLKVFDTGDLNQQVIRPREYDALLFGEIVGRDTDLFAFWHSSQRNDPGLNIALYANITADKLLETSRASSNIATRTEAYTQLVTEITDDTPAIFLYTPSFIYAVPKQIRGISIGSITTSSERFTDILSWHIETDTIWPIFADDDERTYPRP